MNRTALITGITGQDGSYLAELLLEKGYTVHGIIRRRSSFNTGRIEHLYQDPHEPDSRLRLHYGDLTDAGPIRKILQKVQPDEIYNLGAMSHVRVSYDQPVYTAETVYLGTLKLLEAVRDCCPSARFYQASSSEMFGNAPAPQNEQTPFNPASPYAVAKVAAHHAAGMYRDAYGLWIARGILFNHESPRRGETFVTRKVTRAVGRIKEGLQKKLYLGNLWALRDWGYAPDYVLAMWMMLQHSEPDDFVIATGFSFDVEYFTKLAFELLGLNPKGHVSIDPKYCRPAEIHELRGDARKAKRVLGWKRSCDFKGLVERMVQADWELAKKEKAYGRMVRDTDDQPAAGRQDAERMEADGIPHGRPDRSEVRRRIRADPADSGRRSPDLPQPL